MNSTPRAIGYIAEDVLAWINKQRTRKAESTWTHASDDDLRRIELCALAAREAAMFHDLYGMENDATAPEV